MYEGKRSLPPNGQSTTRAAIRVAAALKHFRLRAGAEYQARTV
jgi:hypothetical protein